MESEQAKEDTNRAGEKNVVEAGMANEVEEGDRYGHAKGRGEGSREMEETIAVERRAVEFEVGIQKLREGVRE